MNLEDLGLNGMLVGLIKPHIPKITQKIIPIINDQLVNVLQKSDAARTGDEAQSAIMIFRNDKDEVFITVAKLSATDQVLTAESPVLLTQFFSDLINKSLKEE